MIYRKLLCLVFVLGLALGLAPTPSFAQGPSNDQAATTTTTTADGNKAVVVSRQGGEVVVLEISSDTPAAYEPSRTGKPGDISAEWWGWYGSSYGWWSGWMYACYSGTCDRYFMPNTVGNNAVQVRGTNGSWGTVKLYWRNGSQSWNYFTSMPVDGTTRTARLYSGSTSINYRFQFIESGGAGDAQYQTFQD